MLTAIKKQSPVVDSTGDAFCAFDADWECVFFSDVIQAQESQPAVNQVGKHFEELFPEFKESGLRLAMETALAKEDRFEFDSFNPGAKTWKAIRIYRTAQGYAVFTTDITERIKEQAAVVELAQRLEKQTRIFDTTLSHIKDFAYIFDRQGRFIYANKPLLDLWGLELELAMGKNFFDLNYPDDLAARLQKQIQQVIDTKATVRDETLYVSPTGVKGVYEYIFSPVFGPNGEVDVVAGSTRDITDHKTAREELERRVGERTTELTDINNQMETLVYSIAHDLRAPLRSMQAFAQLLLDEHSQNWDESAQTYARRIVRSAEKMNALTLDLLNYGRISRSELKLEPVRVQSAWNIALEQHEVLIRQKGARIETTISWPTILANEATLSQVLSNLLGNSLKFSKSETPPRIRFWTEDKGRALRLWIEDEGIGIQPEFHERIFRLFERLNGTAYEGTGIGLSIVRKGVERMQGRLGLESDLGKGARFWLEFSKVQDEPA